MNILNEVSNDLHKYIINSTGDNLLDYAVTKYMKYIDNIDENNNNNNNNSDNNNLNELSFQNKIKYYVRKFTYIMEENEKLKQENIKLKKKYYFFIKNIERVLIILLFIYIILLKI